MVALCDADLIGKRFEEDIRQLECRSNFFKEREITQEEAIRLIKTYAQEDATFNIVGREAVKTALQAGIITQRGIATIQGIPFALVLV